MRIRSTLMFVGAALSGWALSASAALEQVYSNDFETAVGPGWTPSVPVSLTNGGSAAEQADPTLFHTHFLGDFGGTDQATLHLTLPQKIQSVTLSFDVYMLRTWDGNDPHTISNARPGEPTTLGGPDVFGYGYNGTTLLAESFSHGAGLQSYCVGPNRGINGDGLCQAPANGYLHDPTFDYALQDKLGYKVLLDPHDTGPNVPQVNDPMSMVYHLKSTFAYTGGDITFKFFSSGLQVHDLNDPTDGVPRLSDESWGLDNINVSVASVPEPRTWTLLGAGLLLTSFVATRRKRSQR